MTKALVTEQEHKAVPLVIDLDGTLVRSDLLVETAFSSFSENPPKIYGALKKLCAGRAAVKEFFGAARFSPALLPYDSTVLAVAQEAIKEGRPVYLASAANERIVEQVAEHLDIFSGWFGSSAVDNLSGHRKADKLVEAFGRGKFDYVGNAKADMPIWTVCRKRLAVRAGKGLRKRLVALDSQTCFLAEDPAVLRDWFQVFRVHQYAKNILVFVPLLTSHSFDFHSLWTAVGAMVAFSMCASGVYIVNDLVDLEADRAHPEKRIRPFAAGKVSVFYGVFLAPLLLLSALGLAFVISLPFFAAITTYLLLTTSYTFYIKRRAIIDVIVLALLYTIRVIAGGLAIGVSISEWLLGFSIFIFMALALIKRYIELSHRIKFVLPNPFDRDYRKEDLPVIGALAAAAGFNAVTLFCLYLSSDAVRSLYRHPRVLWLIRPLLLYWISRLLMVAHRGAMQTDPVVYALSDRLSRVIVLVMIGVVLLAI